MESNLNNNKKKTGNIEIGLMVVSVAILALFIILMVAKPDATLNAIDGFFCKMISV